MVKGKNPKAPYYGDLDKTQALGQLFEVATELRDERWRSEFFKNVADASFQCGTPQVIQGPDGFPYFQLNMPEPYKEFQCFVVTHLIDDFLLENGLGVVINANKGNPDWVFSYGDIVNYSLRKEFYSSSTNVDRPEREVIQEDEQVLVAQPSESFLPLLTRKSIRTFLASFGISDCKILLMTRSEGGTQELVFNLTPDKFQTHEQWQALMRSISWYLPRHYTFVSMKESSIGGFEVL